MEYLILVYEFFASKRFRSYFSLLVIPFLISLLLYLSIYKKENVEQDYSNIVTLLGILLGFTISLFAIFLSANNSSIRKSKNTKTRFKVLGKILSVFDVMQTSIAYVIMMECILLVLNIILPVVITNPENRLIFFVINIGVLSHIVIILLRSVLDFYFAISLRSKE